MHSASIQKSPPTGLISPCWHAPCSVKRLFKKPNFTQKVNHGCIMFGPGFNPINHLHFFETVPPF
uniref:Uncharacterized protein n=1 Tax=Arundo donax TaxID=35708 RepID=A0A0A8XY66_ARUDO